MQKHNTGSSYANEETFAEPMPILASQVEDDNRLAFLPAMFGTRHLMQGEALVYAWMRRLNSAYDGGFWNFWRLSNGGFYLAPAGESPVNLSVSGNGFEGSMSPEAAGIVASLFALGQLASEIDSQGGDPDDISERYHWLRDFACMHPEASLILCAID